MNGVTLYCDWRTFVLGIYSLGICVSNNHVTAIFQSINRLVELSKTHIHKLIQGN